MEWLDQLERELPLCNSKMTVGVAKVGGDILIAVEGGEKSHIGSVVIAVPRESLTGDGSPSATSSVVNVTGHKDEYICRLLAEGVATAMGVTVVCTGGVHVDNATDAQIEEIMTAAESIAVELCS